MVVLKNIGDIRYGDPLCYGSKHQNHRPWRYFVWLLGAERGVFYPSMVSLQGDFYFHIYHTFKVSLEQDNTHVIYYWDMMVVHK